MSPPPWRATLACRVMPVLLRMISRPLRTLPVVWQRRGTRVMTALGRLPRATTITPVRLGTRPADRVEVNPVDRARAVLYLHGGGYILFSPRTHRAIGAHLAGASGAAVYLLDYRLAPEHPYPAAVDDALAAYQDLLDGGREPRHIAIAGDSAGAGLALALAIRLRERGTPLPAALALISPWVDLTLSDPRTHADRDDPVLSAGWLRACAAMYAGRADARLPELSPLFADLAGLPPMLVHTGSDEILRYDAERLVASARRSGIPVSARRLDGRWHLFQVQAGQLAAAAAATREIGEFLGARLAQAPRGT